MRHLAVLALLSVSTGAAAAPLEQAKADDVLSLIEGEVVSVRPYEGYSNEVRSGYVLVLKSKAEGYGDCRSQHLTVIQNVAPGGNARSGPWQFDRLELADRYQRNPQYRTVPSHPCPSPLAGGWIEVGDWATFNVAAILLDQLKRAASAAAFQPTFEFTCVEVDETPCTKPGEKLREALGPGPTKVTRVGGVVGALYYPPSAGVHWTLEIDPKADLSPRSVVLRFKHRPMH